jgi:hypothetical protein
MAQEAQDPKMELMKLSKEDLVERVLALEEGRYGTYDDEKFEYICQQLMMGRTARSIFSSDDPEDKEHCPHRATFYRWLSRRDLQARFNVKERYEFAIMVSMHDLNDELLDIADDGRNDYMERLNKDGEQIGWALNGENIQRSRLRVDTRERMIARMAPKVFGSASLKDEAKTTTTKERVVRMHDVKPDEVPDINA